LALRRLDARRPQDDRARRNGVMPSFAGRLEPAQIKMLVALLEQQRVQ
jgi:hypothetical protein